MFGIRLVALRDKADLTTYHVHYPVPQAAKPKFFLTSYHELGLNGTQGGRATSMAQEAAAMMQAGCGFDGVVVDEGTRLQGGEETYIAQGVLTLDPYVSACADRHTH